MTQRIRVLHLLTNAGLGGAETNLIGLLDCFDHERFEHIAASGGEGLLESEVTRRGVRFIRLSAAPLSLRSVFRIPAMVKQIRSLDPTIIHSHLDLPNVLGLVAKRVFGCRLVLHFHNLAIVPRSELPDRAVSHLLWNAIARTYRYCDRAIAICSYEIPYLTRLGFLDRQIVLIRNGISMDGYPRAKLPRERPYRFVCVARFHRPKNHELLIQAFYDVSQEFPDVRLTLAGAGPLEDSVRQQVKALGVEDRVDFLGICKNIPDILAASDCHVLSSWTELSPMTIIEAMRAGLPAIATDVGGVDEIVNDGVTGYLVKPGDRSGLSRAMLALAADPGRGAEMGASAYRWAADQLPNNLIAKKIEAVYDDILRGDVN